MRFLSFLFGKVPDAATPVRDPSDLAPEIKVSVSEPREQEGPIMRLMNAPQGQWPKRANLQGWPCTINYRDSRGAARTWDVDLLEARQGVASVMLDVKRHEDRAKIALRLDRVIAFRVGRNKYDPQTYLSERFGIAVAMTQGPKDIT